jgi:hypothetical protein
MCVVGLLGVFGGYRFYLGRIGSVAVLLTTILFVMGTLVLIGFFGLLAVSIWGLVAAVLIPGMVRQNNFTLIHRLS